MNEETPATDRHITQDTQHSVPCCTAASRTALESQPLDRPSSSLFSNPANVYKLRTYVHTELPAAVPVLQEPGDEGVLREEFQSLDLQKRSERLRTTEQNQNHRQAAHTSVNLKGGEMEAE